MTEDLASRFQEYTRTLDCVHCGLCLPHCPTYGVTRREADSPRGRIYLMRGHAEGRLAMTDEARLRLDQCLVCRNCESVCPSGIRMGEMVELFREHMNRERPTGLAASRTGLFFLRSVLPSRKRIAVLSDLLEIYQRSGLRRLIGAALRPLSRDLAHAHALQPEIPRRRTRRIETDRRRPRGFPAVGESRARVGLFLGCVASEWFAPVHRATLRVLQRNGCDVVIPDEQTCCGALHRHAGLREEAHELAARSAAAFERLEVDAVIVNAAGCGATLREEDFPVPVLDVCEYLAGLDIEAPDRPVPVRVAYDQPCHLVHAQQVGPDAVENLLRRVPELELVPLRHSERCCGAGGVYNLLHPEMAEAILAEKVAAIRETDVRVVTTGNPGCVLQLRKGLRDTAIEVVHPVELLDRAYS